jgi:hypothetical protein
VPDGVYRNSQLHDWFDYYIKGQGPVPFQGVQTLTQTCGGPSGGATGPFDDPNTDLPFQSPTWAQLAPGEIQFTSAAAKTITPEVSDQAGAEFDPIGGPGACATAPGADQAGTASYRLAAAPAGGFTLMGSPTIVADLNSPSATSQLAARLLDVDPGTGNERLVARGLYRPEINSGTNSTRQVFQLHPNGWKFDTGHIAKLELLPADQPYGRDSNGQGPVTISNLELRLPVLDQPGSQGGLVGTPAAKVVPAGYNLAGDRQVGYIRPIAASPISVSLVPAYQECTSPDRMHGPPLAFGSCSAPDRTSPNLTVGTFDANGQAPKSVGNARLSVVRGDPSTPADESDVKVQVSLTDVRLAAGLADYTGELTEVTTLRITDRQNGNGVNRTGTVQDIPLPVIVPCTATPDTTKGGDCRVSTSVDSLIPGAVPEGKRSVWALGRVQAFDGGPDGDAQSADNSLFAVQGIFIP